MFLETEDNIIIADNVIIGIYNGNLSRDGKYRALVGLELLEGMEEIGASIVSG